MNTVQLSYYLLFVTHTSGRVLRAQMRLELVHQLEELAARVQRDEAALSDRVTAVVRPMLRRLRDELAERAPSGAADPEVRILTQKQSALLHSEK